MTHYMTSVPCCLQWSTRCISLQLIVQCLPQPVHGPELGRIVLAYCLKPRHASPTGSLGCCSWPQVLPLTRAAKCFAPLHPGAEASLLWGCRCSQIMGRNETDELSAAQIFYPCMQCADIFFLKVTEVQMYPLLGARCIHAAPYLGVAYGALWHCVCSV